MINDKLTGNCIVAAARAWLGTPYIHQASKKGIGCDCLGLVRGVWRELVGEEPEETPAYSNTWAEAGGREQLLASIRTHFGASDTKNIAPGDLLLFRLRAKAPAKHLGINVGENRFIHAYEGSAVVESNMSDFWYRCLHSSWRFPGVFS